MLLAIVSYRLPVLSGAVNTALRALLWAVALLAALALCVAVLVAVAPVVPELMMATSITMAYALMTMPRTGVRSCK